MLEVKSEEPVRATKSPRRPDIDVVRIVLTWGILVYHTSLIYGPGLSYYVRIVPDTVNSWMLIYYWLIISMNVWNMPMFFFLSGMRNDINLGTVEMLRMNISALFMV